MNKAIPFVISLTTLVGLTTHAQDMRYYSTSPVPTIMMAKEIKPSENTNFARLIQSKATNIFNEANAYPNTAIGKLYVKDKDGKQLVFTASFFGQPNILLTAGSAVMPIGTESTGECYTIEKFVQAPGTPLQQPPVEIKGSDISVVYLDRETLSLNTSTANLVSWDFAFLRTRTNSINNVFLGWKPDPNSQRRKPVRLLGYIGANNNAMYAQSSVTLIPKNPFLDGEEYYRGNSIYDIPTNDKNHIVVPEKPDANVVLFTNVGAPWVSTIKDGAGAGKEFVTGYLNTLNVDAYSWDRVEIDGGQTVRPFQRALNDTNPNDKGTYLFTPFFDMTEYNPDMFYNAYLHAQQATNSNQDNVCLS